MDLRDHYRFKALLQVIKFLADNETTLSAVASIATVESALKQLVEDIIKADGIATGDISGVRVQKLDARKSLIDATLTVMRSMRSLAIATEDQELGMAARYSRSKLVQMTDSGLYVFCKKTHDTALPLAAQLADHNVTEEQINLVLTLVNRLQNAISDSIDLAFNKKVANAQVIELMKAVYSLMSVHLDVLIDLFEDDEPEMVERYRLARTIGHHSIASAPTNTIGTVNASDPAIIGPFRYGPTKGLLLVNASAVPMHFQMLDDDELVGRSMTVGRMSAFIGVMADLADRGTALHITTASEEPSPYRVEVG
jgi:hypothetical protein